MWRKFLFSLRKFHGWLHEYSHWWKYLALPFGKKAYLIGTPTHDNLGDSAIVLAEVSFLQNNGFPRKKIKEIPSFDFLRSKHVLKKLLDKKACFYMNGGGNIGDQWFSEEEFRRMLIQEFPNKMVVFPQTIYYTATENGEKEKKKSISIYNTRHDLTIAAREAPSYAMLQALYPDISVLLTPDIVLSAHMDTFGVVPQVRKGVLLCLRSDAEKAVSDTEWDHIKSELHKMDVLYRQTDMYANQSISKENRLDYVKDKMQEFAGSELVITDRLHGMIFAAITGTPCIVFSNYNHKVKGTYDWISYLPYIKYARTAEEANQYISPLLQMKNCHYDNTQLLPYFEKLAKCVKEDACRK